jgi:hypothetical protein
MLTEPVAITVGKELDKMRAMAAASRAGPLATARVGASTATPSLPPPESRLPRSEAGSRKLVVM